MQKIHQKCMFYPNLTLSSCCSHCAVQLVYNAQLAEVDPDAGNHPQFSSVPAIQLTYEIVFAQDVIAIQFIPFLLHWEDVFYIYN